MGKEGGIKIAKGILYVISRVAIVIVAIVLIVLAFYTAMHTMNVEMVTKDALSERAQAVLLPSSDDSDKTMLQRLFTDQFLAQDSIMQENPYSTFQIRNYYQRVDLEPTIIWPWEDEVTLTVTDLVTEITGVSLEAIAEDGTIISSAGESEKPPEWKSGVYEVQLVKSGSNTWKVNSMTFLREVEEELPATADTQDSTENDANQKNAAGEEAA